MSKLRRWQLDARQPYTLTLAADARLSSTDYADDQVWELSPGVLDSPALALQTQYGGRANLASLVPMWQIDNRSVYQAQAYARPPMVTAFAPGYLQLQAALTPSLALLAEYWAMESHAVGGQFTLANTGKEPLALRLDLIAQVIVSDAEQKLTYRPLGGGGTALSFGLVGSVNPILLLERGEASAESLKLSAPIEAAPGSKTTIRWVHAAVPGGLKSLSLAQKWMSVSWASAIKAIARAAEAIPHIETGSDLLDATLAASYRELLQGFIRPTSSLPYASLVATRQPERGYSPAGSGVDHIRAWNGQSPMLTYLAGLAVAAVDVRLAEGLLLNNLAVQQDDGWIDARPGLAGQRQGTLCPPILARYAWGLYQYNEDRDFLAAVYPGLIRFLGRWLMPDLDCDGDGLPEWQSEAQTGYPYQPTFARGLTYGQQADIRMVESPDLAAYLLSEAISLREMAYVLDRGDDAATFDSRVTALRDQLDGLWRERHYAYRDRDTHLTTGGVTILKDGRGGDIHELNQTLSPPNRLIVHVNGGLDRAPALTLHLDGADADGALIHEAASAGDFAWSHGRGAYTSRAIFARVDRLSLEGVVRVYRVSAASLDTTRLDINALLPIWSTGVAPEQLEPLIALLTDPEHFWRPTGVTMTSAQDSDFDATNAHGGGGVWPFWLTLIGEGLIEAGRTDLATTLVERLLRAQVSTLSAQKAFSEFYHSDQPVGLGQRGNLSGIAPLHLLLRVLGVRIISASKVWVGGPFSWGAPVTVTQGGVSVRRSSEQTVIRFPTGTTRELPADAPFQAIIDPQAPPSKTPPAARPSEPTNPFDEPS